MPSFASVRRSRHLAQDPAGMAEPTKGALPGRESAVINEMLRAAFAPAIKKLQRCRRSADRRLGLRIIERL